MFVIVFLDYTDVTEVVGTFESQNDAREWAQDHRPDENYVIKPVLNHRSFLDRFVANLMREQRLRDAGL